MEMYGSGKPQEAFVDLHGEREREREGRSQPASRTLALPILLKWEPFELRAHLQTEARSSKSGL